MPDPMGQVMNSDLTLHIMEPIRRLLNVKDLLVIFLV